MSGFTKKIFLLKYNLNDKNSVVEYLFYLLIADAFIAAELLYGDKIIFSFSQLFSHLFQE